MEIKYLDAELQRAADTAQSRPSGWTVAEVTRLRLLVQCVLAAKVTGDLFNMRLLGLVRDPDDNRASAELSNSRSLVLAFKANSRSIIAVLDTAPSRRT